MSSRLIQACGLLVTMGALATFVPSGQAQVAGIARDPGRTMTPIQPPEPRGCITEVAAGDHRFACDGVTHLVMVDEMCIRTACGLIFDIHGANGSAEELRTNTDLHRLAPRKGYLVVHPSAAPEGPGTWSFDTSPAQLADFMYQMIEVFHVDVSRVHVAGFSMGAAMSYAFLCNHNRVVASAAVVTGISVDQVMMPGGARKCLDAIDAGWHPRVSILFMNGVLDPALTPALAHTRIDGIVSRLELVGGERIAGDGHYIRKRWTGAGGMVFEFLEHDYSAEGRLGGHCMPGGTARTTCTRGEIAVHWGETALQWFVDHPKR